MNEKVRGDGELGGGKTLGYYGAAVDSTRPRRMPEGPGVGEDVLLEG
jgi:hypothetical protein